MSDQKPRGWGQPDEEAPASTLSGKIDFTGTYHHYGWWPETNDEPVSPTSPAYKAPREVTAQQAGDSITIQTESPEPAMPLTLRGHLVRDGIWGDFDWTWEWIKAHPESVTGWMFRGQLIFSTVQYGYDETGNLIRQPDGQSTRDGEMANLNFAGMGVWNGEVRTQDSSGQLVSGWHPDMQQHSWAEAQQGQRQLVVPAASFLEPTPSSPVTTLSGVGTGFYVRTS